MRCPFCQHLEDRVVDSRETRDGSTIRRRRECLRCGRRFTSYEQIEAVPLRVVKRDGRREPFQRQKLLSGLLRAAEKRPIETATLEGLADTIERRLHAAREREVSTEVIGRMVMERLREIDQVAYVRFASVYLRFEDLDAFMDVLQGLLARENSVAVEEGKRGD